MITTHVKKCPPELEAVLEIVRSLKGILKAMATTIKWYMYVGRDKNHNVTKGPFSFSFLF